jgi:hypothetical protein
MESGNSISNPVRFNPWKHHYRWVMDRLKEALDSKDCNLTKDEFVDRIKLINSNYIDIYTGSLSIATIEEEVFTLLEQGGILTHSDFTNLIQPTGFLLLTLSDQSVWVLREGLNDIQYIHIHPARTTPLAVRVDGNSWKTVLLAALLYPEIPMPDVYLINSIRKFMLNLSPVKISSSLPRIQKALWLLHSFPGKPSNP